jgi:DNA-directed RNA polymerase specialized sigma24 family protein
MTSETDPFPIGRAAVLAAYAALPGSYRQVLALAGVGHSFEAIAQGSGFPARTVSTWALQALSALSQARLAAEAVAVA